MQKFRKKPVVIEAIQWDGEQSTVRQLYEWSNGVVTGHLHPDLLLVMTKEGMMTASLNDWIIKGIAGEFYPCKPDIFEQTYEEVKE